MSDFDHAEYARRAVGWLRVKNEQRPPRPALIPNTIGIEIEDNDELVPLSDIESDAAVWNHVGRLLRERDPELYVELRTSAIAFAMLAGAPANENTETDNVNEN